jgi:hypothetical protein
LSSGNALHPCFFTIRLSIAVRFVLNLKL